MKKVFGIFFLLALFISCSSDLDFEQTQDLKLNPIFTTNFASFDFKANQFVSSGVGQTVVSDEILFDIVRYESATQYLSRADLYFEFTNTINREYSISIKFLDADNVTVYPFSVKVPAYSGTGIPDIVVRNRVLESAKLDLLRKTHKVAVDVLMDGVPLTSNSLGSIKMRSSATMYFLSK